MKIIEILGIMATLKRKEWK